jgi:hypothetical protein
MIFAQVFEKNVNKNYFCHKDMLLATSLSQKINRNYPIMVFYILTLIPKTVKIP